MKVENEYILVRTACTNKNLKEILSIDSGFLPVERVYSVWKGYLQFSSKYDSSSSAFVNVYLQEDQPIRNCNKDNLVFVAISHSDMTNEEALKHFNERSNIQMSENNCKLIEKNCAEQFLPVFKFLDVNRAKIFAKS